MALASLSSLFRNASSACLRSVMSSAAQITYSTSPLPSNFGVLVIDSKRVSPLPFLTHSSVCDCFFFSKTSLLLAMQTAASSTLIMSYKSLPSNFSFSNPKNSAQALFTTPQVFLSVKYQIWVPMLSRSNACSSDLFRSN